MEICNVEYLFYLNTEKYVLSKECYIRNVVQLVWCKELDCTLFIVFVNGDHTKMSFFF